MTMGNKSPYSNLELNSAAQEHNEALAKAAQTNKSPRTDIIHHEKEVAKADAPIYQAPDHSAPIFIDNALPEVAAHKDPPDEEDVVPRGSRRRCGMKKRTLWIVTVASTIVIIAAIVGGAVGGTRAAKSSNPAVTGALLSTSNLAALNYTDEQQIDHSCVYYQLTSGEIYQSVKNSSVNIWSIYPIATDIENIANGTAISADLAWKTSEQRTFYVMFYDKDNRIRGKLSDTVYTSDWSDDDALNDASYAGNGHSLAAYSKACESCLDATLVASRDAGTGQRLDTASPNGTANTWNQYTLVNDSLPRPAIGSRLDIKPLYSEDGSHYVVLWMTSANNTLAQMLFDGESWEGEELDFKNVYHNAAVAGFTRGNFVYGNNSASSYEVHVLNTRPDEASGGITRTTFRAGEGWYNRTAAAFEDVWQDSGLAATQAGKVYGVALPSDGKAQLLEWEQSSNGIFVKKGAVDTPPSK